MELDSAAKKPRMDETAMAPSKVLHLRNLPDGVTEKEVVLLGVPFGRVANILLLKQKNQAFLEMGDASAASSLVTYYSGVPATVRDRTVYVQYSKHQELKTPQVNPTTGANVSLLSPVMSGGASPSGTTATGSSPMDSALPQQQGCPNSVLRVIIENMLYPITIDVLHQIFSKYGSVLRIVTFVKNCK